MAQKWRVVESRTLIKDRWIDLSADTCLTPSGVVIESYYLLRYPDWVHIVGLTDRDEVALVREYRHAMGDFCLGLPAGIVDAEDPDPETAARREFAEEAGYRASRWRRLASLQADPARQGNLIHVFLAEGLEPAERHLDAGEEGMTVELRPASELIAGLAAGVLPHITHVASLLLALSAAGRVRLRA